jgi:hypothetical protein
LRISFNPDALLKGIENINKAEQRSISGAKEENKELATLN